MASQIQAARGVTSRSGASANRGSRQALGGLLLLCAAGLLPVQAAAQAPARGADLAIDGRASTLCYDAVDGAISFTGCFLGLAARQDKADGSLTLDVDLQTQSSGDIDRDVILRGADWLDAAQPAHASLTLGAPQAGRITAVTLRLRGRQRRVDADLRLRPQDGGQRITGSFTLVPADFGMGGQGAGAGAGADAPAHQTVRISADITLRPAR